MANYIEHQDVPRKDRLTKGLKHVFFTNCHYNEVIIPEYEGPNILTLKDFEKRFAYESSHVTGVLIRHCIKWKVPLDKVVGMTPNEGAQDFVYMYTHKGYIRINTLFRGGILFLNGDYFDHAYFICPTNKSFFDVMGWLRTMGQLLKPKQSAA